MQTDSTEAIRLIQSGLDSLGHAPGTIDGRWGVRTARALRRLIAANGRPASLSPQGPLPWITEAKTALGRNEARVRALENSATRQDTRFDSLSVSINELKQQARETNALLRELAQRP